VLSASTAAAVSPALSLAFAVVTAASEVCRAISRIEAASSSVAAVTRR
jgi:hypothetical protein